MAQSLLAYRVVTVGKEMAVGVFQVSSKAFAQPS
jgi:hypothetical protein